MWVYEKKLQHPVKISKSDPAMAKIIITQLGGPDGELGASMRYLNQRFSMPDRKIAGILTDVGTEELAHIEMVSAIIYQLTRNISIDQIKGTAFEPYYVDHTTGIYPIAASGVPFDMKYVGVKGDPLTDLAEDQAAEQKELKQAVAEGLQQLSEEHRRILVLREINGLSYEEIGAIVGISEKNVSVRLYRIKEQLKTMK